MENGNGHHKNFSFEDYRLETELQTLRQGEAEIHLAKRPFLVLNYLIENRDRLVSRTELLNKFWDGHDVYDDALRKCVGAIRKALNDVGSPPHFIEIRRGSGYRFVGPVAESTPGRKLTERAEPSIVEDIAQNGDLSRASKLKFAGGRQEQGNAGPQM